MVKIIVKNKNEGGWLIFMTYKFTTKLGNQNSTSIRIDIHRSVK